MSETTIVRDFAVPAERLFAALADQEGMGEWMGVKISVPVRGEGGLVGTVRRIHVGSTGFDERIVESEPPHFMAYQIVPPVPLLRHHRGTLRIEPTGPTSCRLSWHIVLDLKLGLGVLVVGLLKREIGRALARLSARLEATHA